MVGIVPPFEITANVHIEYIINRRLYALRTLKKSNLTSMQLVQEECKIVRSVLEYTCPEMKSKRDNELFCLCSKCTCVDITYFVPVCTSAYNMEKHKTNNGSKPSIRVFLHERMGSR